MRRAASIVHDRRARAAAHARRGREAAMDGLDVTRNELARELAARGAHAASGATNARGRTPLTTVLARRGHLRPGEAVTLLAPIAETLALAHGLGATHGDVCERQVALDANGRPLLLGWTPRDERVDGEAAGDLRSLGVLVRRVLDEPPAASTDLGGVLARLDAKGSLDGLDADRLTAALFAWAEPEPIDLEAPAELRATSAPPAVTERPVGGRSAGVPSRGLGAVVRSLLDAWRRRPRVAAAAVVAAALALGLIAVEGSLRVDGAASANGPSVVAPSTPPPATAPGAPSPDPAHPAETPLVDRPPSPSPPAQTPLTTDDPVEAATSLALRRAECLERRDPACLEALFVPGAPGIDADIARMEHPEAPPSVDASRCTLADRAGDVALVHCVTTDGPTIGFTIVRTAGEWRLREVHAP